MLNRADFIGRLGNDPEIRYLPNGDAVASLSIACGEKWKDKQGNQMERTEWVNCSAFGKLADIMGEYLRKGSLVYISGKMQTDKYQDKQTGQDKYSTKIVVREMKMLGGDSQQNSQQQQNQQQAPQQRPQPQQQNQGCQQNGGGGLDDSFDQDIPF